MNFKGFQTFLFLSLICFCKYSLAQITGDKPLKIMSKSRAIYTEEARERNVQEKFRINVVFQADVQIGDFFNVEDNSDEVRKYDLVLQSLNAAKKNKIESAEKDGKKIAFKKILERQFLLN